MSVYIQEIRDIPVDSYGDVRTLVRGLQYQCPEDWQEVLTSLDENSELVLIKEPDNPKDEMAIAAYFNERKIGYVAADDNCKIWMFLTDEKTPCRLIQKYETSFKVSFDNPKQLFESMSFEDIYKDKEDWIEKNRPVMEVPFIKDADAPAYDWYRDVIIIEDFEEFIPDFRRKLASKMITFVARKNSQGNYRYYIPYINAAVAVVEDDMIKSFIDTDGFVMAIPDVSKKIYSGALHIHLNVARLKKGSPLISKFRDVEKSGGNELVFYLNSHSAVVLDEKEDKNGHQTLTRTTRTINDKKHKHLQMKEALAHGEIDLDYFAQIDKLTTDLDMFVKGTLIKSRRLLKKMHKHPYYGYRYDDLKEYRTFAKVFVVNDLCHIYKQLKGSVNINKKEGKILFLYTLKALSRNDNYSYEIFKEMCNINSTIKTITDFRTLVENVIKQQYEEKLPYYPKNDFLMHEILEDENIDLMDMAIEYMELMYKFASAVADAKGKLTSKENKWLSQIASKVLKIQV